VIEKRIITMRTW